MKLADDATPPLSVPVEVPMTLPLHVVLSYRVKVTVPVGPGSADEVPVAFATVASSCTIEPAVTVVLPVMSVPPGPAPLRTLVWTTSSAQHLVALNPAVFGDWQSAAVGLAIAVVDSCSDWPSTDTVAVAFTTSIPAELELSVTVQVPAAFVEQGEPVIEPGPLTLVTVQGVPTGGATGPEPVRIEIVQVNVCVLPTAFTPFGAIAMLASTQHLVASNPTVFAD
jgi:hypothetical protein